MTLRPLLHRQLAFRLSVLALALCLGASGCFGPFKLTRKLYAWNAQAGDKWPQEFMFLVLTWVPVYGLAAVGDAIIFNSMEFWTGRNPIDETPRRRSVLPTTRRIVRGDAAALLSYAESPQGPSLMIMQTVNHAPAASLHIELQDGGAVGKDALGHVLLVARALPDGTIVVNDAHGRRIASYPKRSVSDQTSRQSAFTE